MTNDEGRRMVNRPGGQMERQADHSGAGNSLATPRLLVETLQGRDRAARDRLWELIRPALERLIERLIAEHRLVGQHDRLVLHALHSAETWLRTQPLPAFDQVSWQTFHAAVLVHVAKM